MKKIFLMTVLFPLILCAQEKKETPGVTKRNAKAECKAEGKTVGAELLECVKNKTKNSR